MSKTFIDRHMPLSSTECQEMLASIGAASLDDLIDNVVPHDIRRSHDLDIEDVGSEHDYLNHVEDLARQNEVVKSHIGLGYYNTLTPPVILRNIFENPGWYTSYTPYQAEISQGRLEALLNFQTMICELTGLPVANASLLDEATAAAEAMVMLQRVYAQKHKGQPAVCAVLDDVFPQTLQVLKTRAAYLNIELRILTHEDPLPEGCFALLLQLPNRYGEKAYPAALLAAAKQSEVSLIVCTDLLYLTQHALDIEPAVCVGSSQRFGVPMGGGGPHAAFFATQEQYSRRIPGRIIGVSEDKFGNRALRMALQTREQHIRKEKATSNICTAQALLAIMAGMYAVYHGPLRLQQIAVRVHELACLCAANLQHLGFQLKSDDFFDTITVCLESQADKDRLNMLCEDRRLFFNVSDINYVSIAFDESHSVADCQAVFELFQMLSGCDSEFNEALVWKKSTESRPCDFMQQAVFQNYHSETEFMRYVKMLENKDYSLMSGMIPLGSCTMKLNAAVQMMPLSWKFISQIHPFSPMSTQAGYQTMMTTLGKYLCEITDLDDVSFQPNSGAQGEYAGILAIRRYLDAQGQQQRRVALIPTSAHGTNPASAVIAGFDVVPIRCNDAGEIDLDDVRQKCEIYAETLALLMVTYPSTHGVFEAEIVPLCKLVHDFGGQVYMDGANLNAQVGLTSPGLIGADVCHINLHKTFAIPHGGGGPGMGPICVKQHLSQFLPGFSLDTNNDVFSVAAAPYSSASILFISYAYMALMGGEGLLEASKQAILKANYIKARLDDYFTIVYKGSSGHVAHELILDCRSFKKSAGVTVEDIAKRLMDYSFHAPTLSWPVPGTLMIEPTESETKKELDRFCDAMIAIYHEIQAIETGKASKDDNVLVNAPHIQQEVCSDVWDHSYSREVAVYGTESLKVSKFWPTVGRINQAKGDRDLICTCDFSDLKMPLLV